MCLKITCWWDVPSIIFYPSLPINIYFLLEEEVHYLIIVTPDIYNFYDPISVSVLINYDGYIYGLLRVSLVG